MRIKWTSIPKVVNPSPAVPWVDSAVAERIKKEATKRVGSKKHKKKTERTLDWFRGSR